MERLCELFRLAESGVCLSDIARGVGTSRQTVRSYLGRARALGLTFERIRELGEEGML